MLMKDKFVRLGVSFARKHANRTKIYPLKHLK